MVKVIEFFFDFFPETKNSRKNNVLKNKMLSPQIAI